MARMSSFILAFQGPHICSDLSEPAHSAVPLSDLTLSSYIFFSALSVSSSDLELLERERARDFPYSVRRPLLLEEYLSILEL